MLSWAGPGNKIVDGRSARYWGAWDWPLFQCPCIEVCVSKGTEFKTVCSFCVNVQAFHNGNNTYDSKSLCFDYCKNIYMWMTIIGPVEFSVTSGTKSRFPLPTLSPGTCFIIAKVITGLVGEEGWGVTDKFLLALRSQLHLCLPDGLKNHSACVIWILKARDFTIAAQSFIYILRSSWSFPINCR